ncbi:hypothetical protein PAXRUDRAFT_830394, partial [Paxillus rubicundulus Ve08.2h10]
MLALPFGIFEHDILPKEEGLTKLNVGSVPFAAMVRSETGEKVEGSDKGNSRARMQRNENENEKEGKEIVVLVPYSVGLGWSWTFCNIRSPL